jgi:hypothetical protein
MKDRPYLIVSGVLFGLITFGHLMRVTYEIPVRIGEWNVPLWPSMVTVVLAFALFVWAFRLVRMQQQP